MIGAGAAGLAAAIAASAGTAPVYLVERTADGGRKILISGGGRCNILPSILAPERFVTDSPAHLLRGMLRAWPLPHMVRFFEDEAGIPLAVEPETGKLFPRSNRARDVRDGLVTLARQRGVRCEFNTRVDGLRFDGGTWQIATCTGSLVASRVILATGGLSVPATGSDGMGLTMARALGVPIHETYPALTPLTYEDTRDTTAGQEFNRAESLDPAQLTGVSLAVRLRAKAAGRTAESTGGFLFTHRGYSGPAVLDISHVCVRSASHDRAQLRAAWSATAPDAWTARLTGGDRHVSSILSAELPERLAFALMASAGVPRDRRTSALTRGERVALVSRLTACPLPWTGHEGYRKAEVTGGGVALDAVDPRTLESRHCPGLYLCGEILDAFGPIGGHNFAWAWATGRAAGAAAARAAADTTSQ